ncbi:cell shape-determining protein MreC [Paenibacillus chitinolyticus]|nr:cell shape-determining protein MreC [Paenibacillus chitinolyticus]
MLKFMGNKRLMVLLVGLICFFILMGLTLSGRTKFYWPEKFLKDSIAWTQSVFYRPAAGVAGFFEDVGKLKTIYDENQILKKRLTDYALATQQLNALEDENKRYKEALGFTERQKQVSNYKYRIADVIAASPDPYNGTITVNLGEKDGIKPNMAVINVDGLLGRVLTVTEFTSNVQLLTDLSDTNNKAPAISATVKGKEYKSAEGQGSYGIIESYDKEKGLLVMNKIDQNDKLAVGDTVITSDIGKVFPSGIPVGTVVSREPGDFGITQKATIKPFADFRHIREVFIIEIPEVK